MKMLAAVPMRKLCLAIVAEQISAAIGAKAGNSGNMWMIVITIAPNTDTCRAGGLTRVMRGVAYVLVIARGVDPMRPAVAIFSTAKGFVRGVEPVRFQPMVVSH